MQRESYPIHMPADAMDEFSAFVGIPWNLPEGTQLRASFGGEACYAVVNGGQISCGQHKVTPSGFANLRGGGNRNAWKAIWLRFQEKQQWALADVCRASQKDALARLF